MAVTIAAFIGLLILTFDKFGLLERLGLSRPSAANAAAELAIAAETIKRLRSERNAALSQAAELAKTRSLEPVLEQIHANAELQAQVLARLVHHNGSFKHMEESLGYVVEGLRAITGTIADLHGLPLNPERKPQ